MIDKNSKTPKRLCPISCDRTHDLNRKHTDELEIRKVVEYERSLKSAKHKVKNSSSLGKKLNSEYNTSNKQMNTYNTE